jgi:hypothetical protein
MKIPEKHAAHLSEEPRWLVRLEKPSRALGRILHPVLVDLKFKRKGPVWWAIYASSEHADVARLHDLGATLFLTPVESAREAFRKKTSPVVATPEQVAAFIAARGVTVLPARGSLRPHKRRGIRS